MLRFVLAFLLGDCLLQSVSVLPNTWILVILLLLTVGMLRLKHGMWLYIASSITLGFALSAWHAKIILHYQLPANQQDQIIELTGIIASMPVLSGNNIKFLFSTNKALVTLTWRKPTKRIVVGDQWRLPVKLKRIHFPQNPGGFDLEAWHLQKKIRARGYVVAKLKAHLITHQRYRYPITQFRQKLRELVNRTASHETTIAWLQALITGDRSQATEHDWQVLRKTGTNHLMAIAGLHIGILSALVNRVAHIGWRLSPRLLLMLPASIAASLMTAIVALYYSLQAGFSLPTQRACFMLFASTLVLWRRSNVFAWYVWAIALLIILLNNPLNVLSESFWLSFVTLAIIIYGMRARIDPAGWWWQWGRVQWVIALGLIPLSLFFYQECSLISFVANCIAIPWLEFFILPFCLLAGISLGWCEWLGRVFLLLAAKSLSGLWFCLNWFAQLPLAVWHLSVSNGFVLSSLLLAFLLLLLPRGIAGRWLGLIFLLPCYGNAPSKISQGEYWLNLIDVGQGLSVLVRTSHHALLYDAGPKLSSSTDAGEQIVVPFLRQQGVKSLDMAVVSHGDNDHRGGMDAVSHAFQISHMISSVPKELPWPLVTRCLAGQQWTWDGVKFTVIYPDELSLGFGNDSSCVIRIDNGTHATLLTADIERFAERRILNATNILQSDILIAPHHGSKTSSSIEFIEAINPQYVLYATGYANRYHFPHLPVIRAYTNHHIRQLNTSETGEIEFHVHKKSPILSPICHRIQQKRYWQE